MTTNKDFDLGGVLKRERLDCDKFYYEETKKRFDSISTRKHLREDFAQLPVLNANIAVSTNLNFEVLGTNADATDVTFPSTLGAIEVQTHGADNDSTIILPHLDTAQTAWTNNKWGTENQVKWEASVRTGAAVTTVLYWAGLKLTNTPTIATDADQAFFRFSTDDSNTTWQCVYSIGGTDTTTSTTVTVSAATNYLLRIEIDSSRIPHFYINDVEVATGTAMTNDVDLIPYVGVQQLAGSITREIYLVYEEISRIIFE